LSYPLNWSKKYDKKIFSSLIFKISEFYQIYENIYTVSIVEMSVIPIQQYFKISVHLSDQSNLFPVKTLKSLQVLCSPIVWRSVLYIVLSSTRIMQCEISTMPIQYNIFLCRIQVWVRDQFMLYCKYILELMWSINIWFGAQCKNCAVYINLDVSVSISVGPCDTDPCQNEGTCKVENGNYSCTCVNHYSGKNCEGINPSLCFLEFCLQFSTLLCVYVNNKIVTKSHFLNYLARNHLTIIIKLEKKYGIKLN
jgi:hypothetical protein